MRTRGYKNGAIDRVRAKKMLSTLERGVFVHGSAEPTWHQRLRACVIAGKGRACATAQTALFFYGIVRETDEVVFVVPCDKRLALRGGTVIRSRRALRRARVLEDVPVVSVERALLDAAGLMTFIELEDAIETALLKELTTDLRLWTILVEQGGRGVPGSAAFRRILENRPMGRPARSVLEILAGRLLRRSKFTDFVRNFAVEVDGKRYELDFAFPAQRVVLEVDGKAFHSTATQVGRDHKRQRALEAAGWRFLRVSWFDIVCDPQRVVRDLRALLAA